MNIIRHNSTNLTVIRSLVESLSEHHYREPLEILSGSSIGAHVRHILEFYICLLRENTGHIVSYDDRERNHRIETEKGFALVAIDAIILKLEAIKEDRNLTLRSDFSADGSDPSLFSTSLFRELGYCLEHSVHHEALIKVGMKSLHADEVLIENFGVAPSTIRHQINGKNDKVI